MPDVDNNAASAASAASPFQLLLAPEKPAVIAGTTHNLRVLVRMQAPEVDQGITPRHPLHLALVLDRSGSMNGLPLEEAKRCARNIIDSLAPGDRAAIFSFDDQVECVAPLTPATDKLALVTALAGVESGGTTNLHGGWRAGADELAAKLSSQDMHRVILLSDGFANAGETDLEQIALQCKTLAMKGVTTSTYGVGHYFNETLMLAMATAGRGNRLLRADRCRSGRTLRRRVRVVDEPLRARPGVEGACAGKRECEAAQPVRARRRRSNDVDAAGPRVRVGSVGRPRV